MAVHEDANIREAISTGLEVATDASGIAADDDAWAVLDLIQKLGAVRILKAIRDGADCAADVALGSGSGMPDPFGGVTQDDLKRISYLLSTAIDACSVGEEWHMSAIQMLELVDGMGKVRARMTRQAQTSLGQCAPGRHCAHHGNDPFFCCKCGAEFTYTYNARKP